MAMSLGGLASGMDTQAIVEQLVALERQPIYRYEDQISQIEEEKNAWRDINNRISKISDKLTDLKFSSTYNSRVAKSSNEDLVTATATNDAAEANYDIKVTQLAKNHRVASVQQTEGDTFSGDIEINSKTINIVAGSSLNDIRDTINNTEDLGVKASIIDNTLVLESEETGTPIVFSNNPGALSQELGLLDNNGNILNEVQAGDSALLSINGIDITSQSNTINQVVEGMKFEINDIGNATIEVAKDTKKTTEAVQSFVDQYNSVMNFIDSKSNYNSDTEEGAILQGDSTLMRVQSRLRQNIMDNIETGGDLRHISQLGISIDRDGVMSLDKEVLTEALNNDSGAVSKFFNAESIEDGFDGIATKLDGYVDQLIQSNTGLIPTRMDSFDNRIDSLNDSIADVENRVEMSRERYMQQFTAMETALSNMQQQQSWMSSQLTSLGSTNLSSMLQ